MTQQQMRVTRIKFLRDEMSIHYNDADIILDKAMATVGDEWEGVLKHLDIPEANYEAWRKRQGFSNEGVLVRVRAALDFISICGGINEAKTTLAGIEKI